MKLLARYDLLFSHHFRVSYQMGQCYQKNHYLGSLFRLFFPLTAVDLYQSLCLCYPYPRLHPAESNPPTLFINERVVTGVKRLGQGTRVAHQSS